MLVYALADLKCILPQNKTLDLDQFGNVADCKASLSPIVPRAKVDISKIIYRDDGMDEEDD